MSMAAARQGSTGCLPAYLALLALVEYGVITRMVMPLPSTRLDWLVATLVVAPIGATIIAGLAALTIRLTADILRLLACLRRLLTGRRP